MEKIQGSCLCNAISFELNNDFVEFHLCHCTQCQKISGSAHVANLFSSPTSITWHQGEENIQRFDVPGRTISNAFCKQCGTAVPYLSSSGKALITPAGTLDSPPCIKPQDHIFWSERASWYEEIENITKCHGFPE